jgi:hypothetical protein
MRLALLAVVLTACGPQYEDDAYIPDAQIGCADFAQIDAPRQGLHYSPHLDATIEMRVIDSFHMPGFTMIDDAGVTYNATNVTTDSIDGDISTMTLHYELAPSRRATFAIGYFCDGTDVNVTPVASVTFFTDLP